MIDGERSATEPREVHVLKVDSQVCAARFDPSGDYLFAGGFEGQVRWWNCSNDETLELEPLTGLNGWVQPIEFHPAEKSLFTADSWGQVRSYKYDQDGAVNRWNNATAHDGWVRDLAINPDGSALASCGIDKFVRFWSPQDGTLISELDRNEFDLFSVCYHPNGKWLVSGDERGVVRVWDTAKGNSVRTIDASSLYSLHRLQDVGGVRTLSFSPDGSTLAVGGTTPKNGGTVQGPPTILLFDFETGELKHNLKLGEPSACFVHDVVFHPDGFLMTVTSGTPGNGQLIFTKPGDKEHLFRTNKLINCHSLSLRADGRRFAVVTTNKGSNGNGRRLDKNGEYAGNNSPIHIFEFEE